MGKSSSKFHQHLSNGDEYAALQIFKNTLELRHHLNPNNSYGNNPKHHSSLHLAAKHAMKPLLRVFLNELGGDPNKEDSDGQTALHLVCQGDLTARSSTKKRRAACLLLILKCPGSSEDVKKVSVDAVDKEGNAALHYAAATGLQKCVEILICQGASPFIKNNCGMSACDLALKSGYDGIAEFLEARMVFSDDYDQPEDIPESEHLLSSTEEFSGLRSQDLQEAKDQLLVETSDMLHVPLFTAEVLLRKHEWSRQFLLDAWMKDPVLCCEEAGIQPPTSALQSATPESISCEQIQDEYQNTSLNSPAKSVPLSPETMCDICASNIHSDEEPVQVPCLHQFCRSCWEGYLTVKIEDGEVQDILCPAFDCHHLVPVDVIEKVVSPHMVKRYLQFDIEAFVDRNPSIKWCPYPNCGRAVRLPESDAVPQELMSMNCASPLAASHSVGCGNGHYFCWECLGKPHAPCGCEKWKEWHEKIAELKPEELENTYADTENAANCLWMVVNSKPCPNCKSPIQKNEGCNHMKCPKCKYDYCWVCLEGWKKHVSSGYFRCNRFEAVQRAETKAKFLINEAEKHNKEMQELKRFLTYYAKYKAHEISYKCEEGYMKNIDKKLESLHNTLKTYKISEMDTSFLEEATSELLCARRTLYASYVYGYFLEDNGYNKTIFELMQDDLEDTTEKLSDMVACRYIQTPSQYIKQMAAVVKQKRLDFMTAVLKGLIPPETPPNLRKSQRRRYPGLLGMDPVEDEELTQAIMASLKDMNPKDPWVKDHLGKHTNLSAMYDWPDTYSDEEDSSVEVLTANLFGVCSREGCSKPRARNPRTGQVHEYCSLLCLHADKEEVSEQPVSAEIDPSMDLLIAIEMSKLQLTNNESLSEIPDVPESELEVRTTINSEDTEQEPLRQCILENTNQIQYIDGASDTSASECLEISVLDSSESKEIGNETQDISTEVDSAAVALSEENALDVTPSKLPTEVSFAFYLKTSYEESNLNLKNMNCPPNSFDKTEKELFTEVNQSDDISNSDVGENFDDL